MASRTRGLPQQVKDQLSAVQWFVVSLHVNGGVSGMLRADARDDQAAEQAARRRPRRARGRRSSWRGRDTRLDADAQARPDDGHGKTVAVSFTVPPEILDMINGVAAA